MLAQRRLIIVSLFLVVAWYDGAVAFGDANLRQLTSQHYRIFTDLDQSLANDLAVRMDAMYEEYSRRLADFRASDEVKTFDVYLFCRREDYLKFTDNRMPNTAGVFISGKNVLAAFLDGQGRDSLRRTLQHEAFHQFAFTAIGPNLPIWLNEGLAQIFEEGIWTGHEFWIAQVPPRRIRQMQADSTAKRLVDFKTFMHLSNEQWAAVMARDADLGATYYNQAWAMLHFLINGGTRDAQYRQRLVNMLRLLHEGREGDEAFTEAFGGNIAGFQARFTEYIRDLKPTPEATIIEHQSILADMLVELSKQDKTFNDITTFKQTVVAGGYRLRYSKGQMQWNSEPNAQAYFSDLQGQPYSTDQLYFESHAARDLPDIVCRCSTRVQLRTRFYSSGERLEHETLIEAVR